MVAAGDDKPESPVREIYPVPKSVADEIPPGPREYLRQAILTVAAAPDGSAMLCASAVDAMLKECGYEEGWLNVG